MAWLSECVEGQRGGVRSEWEPWPWKQSTGLSGREKWKVSEVTALGRAAAARQSCVARSGSHDGSEIPVILTSVMTWNEEPSVRSSVWSERDGQHGPRVAIVKASLQGCPRHSLSSQPLGSPLTIDVMSSARVQRVGPGRRGPSKGTQTLAATPFVLYEVP